MSMTPEKYTELSRRQKPDEVIGEFVKRIAKVPLCYHPGEDWVYSRATCVVGHLVEILSGMTLAAFFQERIFQPLKMPDTAFYLPLEKLDRFATNYTPGPDQRIQPTDPATSESRFVEEPHVYFMGSGGLTSTAADYFRFNQMLLNEGELEGERLLGRKTVELMTRNHTGDFPIWLRGPWFGFGLGFAVLRNTDHLNTLLSRHPGPVPWSVGTYLWSGAYGTYAWVDPIEDLVGVLMTQVGPYRHLNIRKDFVGLTYQALVD
jgi:CubicO group peptidase (beta-lactamase class C family)